MARVIPTGGSDQTAFFMARNAAADDALARLYMSLIAKREDRKMMLEQQKELLGIKQGYDMEKTRYMYPDGGAGGGGGGGDNPFASGTGTGDNPLLTPPAGSTPKAPAPASKTSAAPAGRPGDPPKQFLPGAGAPSTDHFSAATPATPGEAALRNAFAQQQLDQETNYG